MLGAHPEIEVVGEAATGVEASAMIRALAPDIAFLDIMMPDRDGFRLLAELAPGERPAVVFVTAHRQYALEAFGVSAVDYLLKPFSRQRLAAAVSRVQHFLRGSRAPHDGGLEDDHTRMTGRERDGARLAVRDRGQLIFVERTDVACFEVYGNYVRLVTGGRRFLLRTTLSALTAKLDPAFFVRVSRSLVVNLQHVKSVRHRENGQYELVLSDGSVRRSSRRYRRAIKIALAG